LKPSALAVLRLTASSYLTGFCTGSRHLRKVALSPKTRNGGTRGALPQARVQRVQPLAGEQQPEEPTMRKIFGVVVFATALIGSASVAPAQSSRDLTEPTGTEANRIKTQTGSYYGRRHRAYAYSSGLHRRWHWSHRRW
jgi:hypothetical protein